MNNKTRSTNKFKLAEKKIGNVLVQKIMLNRATLMEAEEYSQILSDKFEEGNKKIVLDLSLCDFIDSTFLAILISHLKKIIKNDGDLRLVGFRPAPRSMFELTGLTRVFKTFRDVKSAVNSFNVNND